MQVRERSIKEQQTEVGCVPWGLLRGMSIYWSDFTVGISFDKAPSLLLLSEFHPRSMHFPSGDDDNEILAPLEEDSPTNLDSARDMPSTGENTISLWTEPALRSDRMCWSLISTAYALAYELGLFGNFSDGIRTATGAMYHKVGALSEGQRADRVKRLLFIYVTQTSGRLGFPSMFPEHGHDCGFVDAEFDSLQGQQLETGAWFNN